MGFDRGHADETRRRKPVIGAPVDRWSPRGRLIPTVGVVRRSLVQRRRREYQALEERNPKRKGRADLGRVQTTPEGSGPYYACVFQSKLEVLGWLGEIKRLRGDRIGE